jgi:DNA polymerase-3 subunit delta
VFESKKLYENQVEIDKRILASKKYTIEPKAVAMLVEFFWYELEQNK